MISTSRETGFCGAFNGDTPPVEKKVDSDGYVTLTTDDWYFVLGGVKGADTVSVQITTDAAIAGTFTVEACLWPRDPIQGAATKTDTDETAGIWIPVNIAAAGYAQGAGTGWTITVLSLVKTAGVGGAVINLSLLGYPRLRLKFACTTGGKVAVIATAKS